MPDLGKAALQYLKELIAIPSDRGKAEIVDYLAHWARSRGYDYEVRQYEGRPLNITVRIGDEPKERAGSPNHLVFNSHFDTVPPGDIEAWPHNPFTPVEKDGRLYGLGSCDAKGSLAAMMAATEALASKWRPGDPTFTFLPVGEEERGNVGIRREVAAGLRAGAAVVGEPTGLVPMAATKGVLRLEITAYGKAAHASQPELGANAIYPITAILEELEALGAEIRRRSEPLTGRPSLVVTTISGGTALNVIPERCSISIDRRMIPGEVEETVTREVQEALERAKQRRPGVPFELKRVRGMNPAKTDPSHPIVTLAQECAAEILGRPVEISGFSACCDGNILINDGNIPTVIWGPGDLGLAHQVGEWVEIAQVEAASYAYTRLGERWIERARA